MNTLRVIVEVDPALVGGDDHTLARALERGHVFSACKGGVRWRRQILRSPDEAVDAIAGEARQLLTQSLAAGGDSTATGRWLHDRARLAIYAARSLHARRRKFWPAHGA